MANQISLLSNDLANILKINLEIGEKRINLEDGKCVYCKIDSSDLVVKCKSCSLSFCNGKGQLISSHIIYHLINAGHKEIDFKLEGSIGSINKCNMCGCGNVFKLGYLTTTKGRRILLCRPPCEKLVEKDISDKIGEKDKKILIKQLVYEDIDQYIKGFKDMISRLCVVKENLLIDKDFEFENWLPLIIENSLIDDVVKNISKLDDLIKCNMVTRDTIKLIQDQLKCLTKKLMQHTYNDVENKDIINIKEPDSELIKCEKPSLLSFENGKEYAKEFSKILKFEKDVDFFSDNDINGNEVIFRRGTKALEYFENNFGGINQEIYEILLGKKTITYKELSSDLNCIDRIPNLPPLNESQRLIVNQTLIQPFCLIQGPPGTGKTYTAAAIVYNYIKRNPNEKVLVVAPSNFAADNIAEAIFKTGVKVVRILSNTREANLDYNCRLSVHHQLDLSNKDSLLSKAVKNYSYIDKRTLYILRKACIQLMTNESNVICLTCSTSASKKLPDNLTFKFILIDEVCQALEPDVLIPLGRGVQKLVIIGDVKQLPPVVKNPETIKAGLEKSLMERLILLGNKPLLLDVQYRMHPLIAKFPNFMFYDNLLKDGIKKEDRILNENFKWLDKDKPIMFICCNEKEQIAESGFSYLNRKECFIIRKVVDKLVNDGGIEPCRIGIITPYEGQKSHLRQNLPFFSKCEDYKKIDIHSVNAFQGREKDVIILSTVRCNSFKGREAIGFLKDSRRLNVALTRAKYGMIVVGDPDTLCNDQTWFEMLQFYQKNNLIFKGPVDDLKVFDCKPKNPKLYI